MFQIKNLSNNPLPLGDGKLLAAGESRTVKSVGEKERGHEARGWLRIRDLKPAKAEKKAEPAVRNAQSGKEESK